MSKIGFGKIACIIVVSFIVSGLVATAQTFTTLATFSDPDGLGPTAISQGTNGNFDGVGSTGGKYGYGTVFEVAPSGTLTVLYNFCPQTNCADGAYPSGLMQAGNGNFYGITQSGGAGVSHVCHENIVGCGTVFEITPGGKETALYDFCSKTACTDGQAPGGMLVQGVNGNLYGTTYAGGTNHLHFCDDTSNPCGTIFEITTSGALTTLHQFCSQPNCADGHIPFPLVQATDGNFYGTTGLGGANKEGTFFEMKPSGTLTTLYSFTFADTDGFVPLLSVPGVDGNYYGVIEEGSNDGGSIVELTPSGRRLRSTLFASPCAEDTPRHTHTRKRRKLLRDDESRREQQHSLRTGRLWHHLRTDAHWTTDHLVQLLLANELHRWRRSEFIGARHRRFLVRNYGQRMVWQWKNRLWDRVQVDGGAWSVCEGEPRIRQGRVQRQHSGKQSDRRHRRHV